MKVIERLIISVFLLIVSTEFVMAQKVTETKQKQVENKPNIIFILTDDLGYGDVGVFFQNQRRSANNRNKPWVMTPHLDKMAAQGAVLEHYSAAPVCAPSRASLLLGQSQGHANVRDNQFDKALADNYTIGNVMQMAGYKTVAIGKWGLQGTDKFDKNGNEWPAYPLNRGFDNYYGYIHHHDGHEHYPKEGLYRGKKQVYDNRKEISSALDNCYTGDLFTAKAKQFIIEHQKGAEKAQPFMMYLAYDTPHAVLELPAKAYPEGFGLNGGLQWIGKDHQMINTADGVPDSYYHPDYKDATYDDDHNAATPEVPWPDVYKRYATVTRRIDNQVNDVIQLLRDLKIDENTLVVFTSDNGPSAESYLKQPYHPDFFGGYGPFDGIKRDLWEGGARVPTIALWPGHIKAGTVVNSASIFYDWMPTFTDLAGLPAPVVSDGISLLPDLLGKESSKKRPIYFEYFEPRRTPQYEDFAENHKNRLRKQMQMIRIGDTVAVRYDIKSANDDFEIYDIRHDLQQVNDLTKTKNLSTLQEMLKAKVLQIRKADSTAKRPYDHEPIPSVNLNPLQKGWLYQTYANPTSWLNVAGEQKGKSDKLKNLEVKAPEKVNFYQAYIEVPESGYYTFKMKANGKAFLRIHDIAVIDEDFAYTAGTEKQETLHLAKGMHPIRIYYTGKGNKNPGFEWSCSNADGKNLNLEVYH